MLAGPPGGRLSITPVDPGCGGESENGCCIVAFAESAAGCGNEDGHSFPWALSWGGYVPQNCGAGLSVAMTIHYYCCQQSSINGNAPSL